MSKLHRAFTLIAALAAAAAAPLWAQTGARYYVATNGSNANNCTRSQPCLTFAGALGKAAAGSVVSCVDAGNFGQVVINAPVTIDCTGTGGAIFTRFSAVIIQPPPNSPNFAVVIRGLEIASSVEEAEATSIGIRFTNQGGSLTIEDSTIRGFFVGGIDFNPTLATRLHIVGTSIVGNGNPAAGTGAGIRIDPSGPGYANVTLEQVQLIGNADAGLLVDVTNNTNSSSNVVATRSSFLANRNGISALAPAGTAGASVLLGDSIVNGNLVNGLFATGPAASIIVSNTTISGNSNGIAAADGGIVASTGNNRLTRNGVNGAFNGFPTEN